MSNFDRHAKEIKHTSLCSISLGSLNPSNWSIGGTSVGDVAGKLRDVGESALVAPLNMAFPGSTNKTQNWVSKGAKSMMNTGTGRAITDTLSGVGVGAGLIGGGALAAPYLGFGSAATPAAGATTGLMSDPVLAGDVAAGGGQAWAPLTGAADAATAEAPAAATAAATGAGMSTAQKIALGLAGANALFGGKKQPLNPDLMAGATPAQTTSASILDQFNKGQLNASDQYSIAKWAEDTKAKKQQYYQQAGLADSSMAQQDIAQIDAQAGAMRDQALQNMLQGGLAAAGIANTATGQAVQLQMQQDQQAQQAQQQFFELLAFSLA